MHYALYTLYSILTRSDNDSLLIFFFQKEFSITNLVALVKNLSLQIDVTFHDNKETVQMFMQTTMMMIIVTMHQPPRS